MSRSYFSIIICIDPPGGIGIASGQGIFSFYCKNTLEIRENYVLY
jgi:hypothetical protein